MTCGDVYYEVSVSQGLNERHPETTADTFHSLTKLNNSLTVTVTVTASDRVGKRNGDTTVLQLRISEGKFVSLRY